MKHVLAAADAFPDAHVRLQLLLLLGLLVFKLAIFTAYPSGTAMLPAADAGLSITFQANPILHLLDITVRSIITSDFASEAGEFGSVAAVPGPQHACCSLKTL